MYSPRSCHHKGVFLSHVILKGQQCQYTHRNQYLVELPVVYFFRVFPQNFHLLKSIHDLVIFLMIRQRDKYSDALNIAAYCNHCIS